MKILLVEDNIHKQNGIVRLINETFDNRVDIKIVDSLELALAANKNTEYDLFLIDLSIKSKEHQPSIDFGLLLFDELKIDKKDKLIVYSTYDNIQSIGQEKLFEQYNIPFIDYTSKDKDWHSAVLMHINQIIRNNNIKIAEIPYDIAITTALNDEFEYMLKASKTEWVKNDKDDLFVYYTTKIKDNNGTFISVVAYTNGTMGMSNAASISMKMALKFRPKILLMTGICAGIKDKTHKGDIIIPEYVFNYQEGDIKDNKFIPAFKPRNLNQRILKLIEQVKTNYSLDIKNEWEKEFNIGKMPSSEHSVHVGGYLGSGSAVVKSAVVLNDIQELYQKNIIGLDMEAYSIFIASENSEVTTIPIVIKAVQDFADSEKDKEYRAFSCYASARFFFKFCEDRFISKLSSL